VLILLPPSEGKWIPVRGRPLDLDTLSFPELNSLRASIIAELGAVSARSDGTDILQLPTTMVSALALNARVPTAPTATAGQVYAGVLYAALDLDTLSGAALRRARSSILVISALWGAVRLRDRIPSYRLSMAVTLPGHPPLAARWRPELARVVPAAAGRGLIVDCRSSTYAAAWQPTGSLAGRTVGVRVFREIEGRRTVVSHMAKHTRGLVARAIVSADTEPRRPAALADLLAESFDVSLTQNPRGGYFLDVTV
jgi:cytoplasmic iron level regulating protein YaaA (DUF328/UPF0246 family)